MRIARPAEWPPLVFLVLPLLASLIVVGSGRSADPSADADNQNGSAESEIAADEEFDRYLDIRVVGLALNGGDARTMGEVAALLALAEKAVGRNHASGLTSELVLQSALDAAVDADDRESLARLAAIARASGIGKLTKRIDMLVGTTAPSRSVGPTVSVAIDATTPDQFFFLQTTLDLIRTAQRTRDRDWLQDLRKQIENEPIFDVEQRKLLLERIGGALAAAGEKSRPQDRLLQRLSHASRSYESDMKNAEAAQMTAFAKLVETQGSVPKARAEANKTNAEALSVLEDVMKKRLENNQKRAEVYWAKRNLWLQNMRSQRPQPASPGQYEVSLTNVLPSQRVRLGKNLSWPKVLQTSHFDESLKQVNAHWQQRSPENSGRNSESCQAIHAAIAKMRSDLTRKVRQMSPIEYATAVGYLAAVAYDATLPIEAAKDAKMPAADPLDSIFDELHDEGFDPYVSHKQLVKAWIHLEPQALVDVAAGLANGEKAIARKHKAIEAADMFRFAAAISVIKNDKAAQQRLAKISKDGDTKDLAARVNDFFKVAGGTSRGGAAPAASVEDTNLATFMLFQALTNDIRAAGLLGNEDGLQALLESVDSIEGFTAQQRTQLREVATAATAMAIEEAAAERLRALQPGPTLRTDLALLQLNGAAKVPAEAVAQAGP